MSEIPFIEARAYMMDSSAINSTSGRVHDARRASQASAGEWESSSSAPGLEDRTEDGEPALAHLDGMFLHRVIRGPHLFDLQIPHELAVGPVKPEQHNPFYQEPLVAE